MGLLDGKVIVVTGSTRGFGLAMVRAFGRAGGKVVLSSRSASSVQQALDDLGSEGFITAGKDCDVTDLESVRALAQFTLEQFGQLDVWVNNAGFSPPYGPTAHAPVDAFIQTTQTNVLGAYHGSLVAMRHFLSIDRGKLINIFGRGERGPQPMQNAYASSKAWLNSFTLALAQEYRSTGVGVFGLSPGMMDTDLLTDVEVIHGFEDRLRSFQSVVQTLSQPPEIPAERAVWLASSATDGKTGLVARELTGRKLLALFVKAGLAKILGRPARSVEIHIRSVPAEFGNKS